ncbi:hypothetical protein [Tabrizicola sp. YIM 78059]|uniref:hypothetical protein n=1 Tax=Tabrizicola sp. YIM 78059 TaxID=2529861 RepID=UPI0010A9EF89|nr:hypothetical protein [Tabrizicola sp. YIM 78059]
MARLALGVAVVALVGTAAFVMPQWNSGLVSAAWAEDDGEGKGQGGPGDSGNHGDGQKGQDNRGQGQGQGGPSSDSDGQGPQAGGPAGTGGGKPVWAQEGIPEVELGRLNVARSPAKVLDRAYAEAVASLTPEMIAFYNLSVDDIIEELTFNFDNVAYIDSPLQNLALLKDALDGTSVLASKGVSTDNDVLMAVFLAVAADKEGEGITADTVIAVTTILGTPIEGDAAADLAELAESIRLAVVAGHNS